MKFYCVSCDAPMSLVEVRGPEDGSMTIFFACPTCARRTAMVTNASETRIVRSLGLKLGGDAREAAAEGARLRVGASEAETAAPGSLEQSHPEEAATGGGRADSRCPFGEVVADAFENQGIAWTAGARVRIERIPEFARRMAMRSVEDYAVARGYTEISEEVLDEARGRMGM